MKKVIIFLFLIIITIDAKAYDWSWAFSSSEDEFSSKKTYKAYITEPRQINFDDYVSDDDYESFLIGVSCDISKSGDVERFFIFDFFTAFNYYNSDIRILFKVGESTRKLYGKMFSDSMNGGYANLSKKEFYDITDLLAKGRNILYRIESIGYGESKGENLTLRGSLKAVNRLIKKCG